MAEAKKLAFDVELAPHLPRAVYTDAKRLQQILKNLLWNAFKFTERGKVTLSVAPASEGWSSDNAPLNRAKSVLALSVSDTGIGIAPDKQQIIFEAFQQADGSTSRKYGGTGLGLAISRELARLLGGEIRLVSTPGAGSTFTLYLPQSYVPAKRERTQAAALIDPPALSNPPREELSAIATESAPPPALRFNDDRDQIQPGDRVVLIVENDARFSPILLETAREQGFKGVIEARGADALARVQERKPSAITLDINLPDMNGWTVLARLKDDVHSRHIPVHLITGEDERERGLRMGAIGALIKPLQNKERLTEVFSRIKNRLQPQTKHLLVVHHDEAQRRQIIELVGGEGLQMAIAGTGQAALAALKDKPFSAAVVSLDLPDAKGFELIEEIKNDPHLADLPLILFLTRELTRKEESHLKRLSQTMNLREARSLERLLDETTLFLHCDVSRLPEAKRQALEKLRQTDTVLAGKKVLIVDDDIRNIFAMTSLLERYQMQVFSAETGKAALDLLQTTPDTDVVLMDIMMPAMDGYDTMRAIRKFAKFRALPVIALTAKAMKGDREKCIDAGASDYIAKPVDTTELLSMLRLWLYR